MNIRFAPQSDPKAAVQVHVLTKNALDGFGGQLPQGAEFLADAAKQARFDAAASALFEGFASVDGTVRRILLVGLGEASSFDLERAGSAVVSRLQTSGVEAVEVVFSEYSGLDGRAIAHFALGLLLRDWRIDTYRTKLPENSKPTLKSATIVSGQTAEVEKLWPDFKAVAEGVRFTRELVSEPANVIYPESFVERCQKLKGLGVELTVLDEKQMKDLGMGALLGVAQGSVRPPRLLAMRWDGTGGEQKTPVCFVGKGVTFDTGGISLKPGPGMEDMKWDMGGAGAVAGAMMALAGRKAKAHVVGVVGLVENMPDGNAQRPGDIVTSMSGQTIEVLNTDAEGRLVLCDAMWWTQETHKPSVMLDFATLTGAIIISLGNEYAGMMCNNDDLAVKISAAGTESGDPVWRMPLGDAYNKLIDSPIADIKNVGPREAGSITAAQFLQRFVQDGVEWAHIDIAGMVWAAKPGATWDKGATGYGVRLMNQFVADNFEG